MQKDIQAEVILCPSCNEEVPKTLYCLNCGYPLYRIEYEQAETEITEETAAEAPEPIEVETPEPDIATEPVSLFEEAWKPSVEAITEAETEAEKEIFPLDESEHAAGPAELVEDEPVQVEADTEAIETSVPEEIMEEHIPEAVATEEEIHESFEEAFTEDFEEEAEIESVEEEQEEPVEEAVEKMQEMPTDFEPDPLVTMVMEQVAKNISLKIRLINLLIEDNVKEATFNRLYETYSAKGDRWITRRTEMLERNRYDMESMDKSLTESGINIEELEIRRAIGDASEEEYEAKSSAFEWDIQQLEQNLQRMRGENAYLGDLAHVMSAEDVKSLREIAEGCYEALDHISEAGKMSSETAERVKASLEDALECLRESSID